jgi:peptidoglycan hydrolase-like protein with peptidoglycan-binding domain
MLARLRWLAICYTILSMASPLWLGFVAMVAGQIVKPAEAEDKDKITTSSPMADVANGQPLIVVISLNAQKIDIYRGTMLIASSQVSSGKPGYATPVGAYSILEKQRWHASNIYSGAPMPWMQRLTWSGMALHGGVLPGYPASHGCVRLHPSFASKLFHITTGGENVVVARNRPAPGLMEHPNIFQPRPTPHPMTKTMTYKPRGTVGPTALAQHAPQMGTEKREAPAALRANRVDAGIKAAALQAAEPRSAAPLRILVTRQGRRDRIIGVQNAFATLGYLEPQNFDGTIGKRTIAAIKAFQKANGLEETGTLTDDLMRQIHAASKIEPPTGRVFVRQAFDRVLDAPVTIRNSDLPLGIHVYTALKFASGDTSAQWMAITVEGEDAASTLGRIEFPNEVRQTIEEKLTPASTLIIADTSINSASLPKGGDFLVVSRDSAKVAKGIIASRRPRHRFRYHYPPWFPFQPFVGGR